MMGHCSEIYKNETIKIKKNKKEQEMEKKYLVVMYKIK
jgi:hypothetical protein